MTIVVEGRDTEARKVEANLYKLVNVVDVQDATHQPALLRELAMIKVAAAPEKRGAVTDLAGIFGAKIVDVSQDCVVLQIAAMEEKIDSLVELLRPIGIRELVRTGQVAMMRGEAEGVRHTPGANGFAPTPNGANK
jgi:acetolactate synthase-1/3 small subunit